MKMKKITRLFSLNGIYSADWMLNLTRTVLCLMLLTVGTVFAQDPAQYGTPYAGVPNRMDANIYQLNIREYNAASRTIAGVRANLQRVKDLGINVVYLMPFYPVSADPKGSDLSPYCIKDLKGVSPDLGTLNDLRGLVEDAHTKGMAVIIDFVVNQTAWDHSWITQHPDWYVKDSSGKIVSPNAGTEGAPFLFGDVAQINLNVVAAQDAMIDAMRYWVFAANIDGFRYDWADKSPQAFWTKALANLRGITSHKLLFLAEGSNEGSTSGCNTCGDNQPGAHYTQGFDYIFGTNFYWNGMKKIWNSGDPVKTLDGVTTGEYSGASSTQLVARFLSDHDDYNADGSPFSFLNGGRNAAMSAFVVATYHRGVPFIYNGLEVGNTAPLPYPWRNGNINWSQDLTVYTEMQKILTLRNSSLALRQGQPISYIDPANTNPDVVAFTKTINAEKVVVLVNVRNSNKTYTIPAGMAGTYNNAFTPGGASINLTAGTVVTLNAYQYLVYTNANVPVIAVTGVSVSPNTVTVGIGSTQQLNATIAPANATNQNVIWTSSNTAVATVNAAGVVSGISAGTSTITAKTADGNKTATSAVTVAAIAVTGVSVSPTSATLYAGATQQLSTTIAPANATNKTITWTSSNTAVATVNSSGLVTAVGAGTANITAKSQDGNKTAVASITVNASSNFTVYFFKPSNWGTGIKIYYWSALPTGTLADASWPGANMTDVANGWYSYTFTNVTSTNLIFNDGNNQTADLSRNKNGWYQNNTWYDANPGSNIAVSSVSINPTSASLAVGGTKQLTPTVLPSNANNKSVTYSSSNTAVATVNASGLITAVANGTATITVKTVDGNKTSTCAVTVATATGTYYTIMNRWKGTYLYDNGANVSYGATANNNSYKWQKIAIDGTYFALKNVATGEYMHIENQTGSVQCNGTDSTWWSAQWSSDNVDGTWIRIRNRWQTGSIIHVENQNGSAQYGNSQDGWFSAQWQLQTTTLGTSKIATSKEVLDVNTPSTVALYPNPSTNNQFNIDLPELTLGTAANITISDMNGKVVMVTKLESSSTINHNLATGLYIVTISTNEYTVSKKLIVK